MACSSKQEQPNNKLVYFDTEKYFNEQISLLAVGNYRMDKTVHHNDENESKSFELVDWSKELNIFRDYNINKTSLIGKYAIDTVIDHKIKTIQYFTTDSALTLKQLSIVFDNDIIVELSFKNSSDNFLYNSHQELTYFPLKGYKVSGKQKTATGQIIDYSIEAIISK
ncbi:MAG: hypothetical protein COC01_07035 [Bacteroidetes bacterium]|nr:MAG: hypothetical protein COC01_07035 [Bacteroidota bacterium]